MLIGTWNVTVAVGRLVLPTSFQDTAAAGLIATRGFDRCLQVFPANSWHELAGRVSALPLTADAARSLRRMLFGAAADLSLDLDGTIMLPRNLLSFAELTNEAVLVGLDTYFEIWHPARWQSASEPARLATFAGECLAGMHLLTSG